ncbi:MAG: response regulator [Acidobacteria bacterium]|nr:response regulator [Acidobacteriota bacterium]
MDEELLELPCPSCGAVHRVPGAGPQGGEVRCDCGERIAFRRAPHQVTGTWPGAGGSTLPPPTLRSAGQPAIREIRPTPEAEMVTCPACGHEFVPAGAGSDRRVVLIVEDTDFFLHLATDVLNRHYRTVGVRTAAAARQALATMSVDMVLLDLTLPDAEGTEVLRALPRRNIPVLVYTSRDETSLLGPEWDVLRSLGARDVVHKGINIEDTLLRKAQALLP